MKARLLPLLVAAILATVLLSGCSDRFTVENRTDETVLVSVVMLPCDVVEVQRVVTWAVVDANRSIERRNLKAGARCLVISNVRRTEVQFVRPDPGARYVVFERAFGLTVMRAGGEFAPAAVVEEVEREDASPKLLWVIGLPAALSALYLGYVGVHFLFPRRASER